MELDALNIGIGGIITAITGAFGLLIRELVNGKKILGGETRQDFQLIFTRMVDDNNQLRERIVSLEEAVKSYNEKAGLRERTMNRMLTHIALLEAAMASAKIDFKPWKDDASITPPNASN